MQLDHILMCKRQITTTTTTTMQEVAENISSFDTEVMQETNYATTSSVQN